MQNRQGRIPRGKGLGGSSLLNYMQYVRGHPNDYDSWDVPGWSFSDVFPYFLKSEDAECCPNDRNHAHGGPLTVSQVQPESELPGRFVNACVADGLPLADPSLGVEGVGISRVTTRQGRRWSTARAFLRPALGRPNLVVGTHAHVTRVRFNEQNEAIGVDFERLGHKRTVRLQTASSWGWVF
jgi:choline dehydrogenase-like flavoprotein